MYYIISDPNVFSFLGKKCLCYGMPKNMHWCCFALVLSLSICLSCWLKSVTPMTPKMAYLKS